MEKKGHFEVVTSAGDLPTTCERVNVSSFFNHSADYSDENIKVNFERVLLLAKDYNIGGVAFIIHAKAFSLKWVDKMLHLSQQVIESFIQTHRLNVYLLVLVDDF